MRSFLSQAKLSECTLENAAKFIFLHREQDGEILFEIFNSSKKQSFTLPPLPNSICGRDEHSGKVLE
jgi:hypothetical protein